MASTENSQNGYQVPNKDLLPAVLLHTAPASSTLCTTQHALRPKPHTADVVFSDSTPSDRTSLSLKYRRFAVTPNTSRRQTQEFTHLLAQCGVPCFPHFRV